MGTQAGTQPESPSGTRSALGRARASWAGRPLLLDAALYLGCAAYALVMALTDKHLDFRVWGTFAVAGYGFAFAHTCVLAATPAARRSGLRSRWVGIGVIAVVGMLAPLVTLVARRQLTGGDWTDSPGMWSAQPEVWIIERSASLLLDTATPYLDIAALGRPAEVDDYTPYGPVMALFGLPRALLGGTAPADALTDARLMFALVAVLCVAVSLRLLGMSSVPLRAAQLAAVFPLTALTWATAGPDLAIVGLLVLGCALAATDRPGFTAVALGLVTSAKLIALPAAVVLAVLVAVRLGRRALARFVVLFAAVCAAVNVPVFLVNPRAFVENVIRFPTGLAAVASPAASPLPGHLVASAGPVGKVLAFVLLGAAGIAVSVWLLRRPPRTGADALLRIAVGLAAFTMLTPATRFGYLVYVSVLLGALLAFRRRAAAPPGAAEPGSGTMRGRAPLTSS